MFFDTANIDGAKKLVDISIGDAGLAALMGYAMVFFGLILLMIVVMAIGKIFTASEKKKDAPVQAPAPVEVPVAYAPGSAGKVMTFDVPDKTAAMLMAIVADKMGKPLNELRFISIKEVKE
jgi:Na+-transporting methylmalonyl-CoA/oxaloacetate decarboxylase gamma subunit